jgi:hypothetical protein
MGSRDSLQSKYRTPARRRAGRALGVILALALAGTLPALELTDGAEASRASISGIWDGYPNFLEARHPDPKIAPPPAGTPPLKPQYRRTYLARRAAERDSDTKGQPLATVGTDCRPYGMPQMMQANYPLEILQTPGQITMIQEAFTQVRRIYLDRPQKQADDVAPGYYGRSVGHWDGGTLVVDTVGVKAAVLGHDEMPHSDRMHITERIRTVSTDVLNDEITVDDPVVLERPWTFTFAYKRRRADYEMMEYVCDSDLEYVDENGVTHFRLAK